MPMGSSPVTRPVPTSQRLCRREAPGRAVEGEPGAPHVLYRTPDERLVWLSGLRSRRHEEVTAFLRGYTGFLIVDGFRGYQSLLTCERPVLAGIQQCCQHISRRAKQVAKLGPGGLQSWAKKVSDVLTEAHTAVEAAKARGGDALDPELLTGLRARYDAAVELGIIHNRLRDLGTATATTPATSWPPG